MCNCVLQRCAGRGSNSLRTQSRLITIHVQCVPGLNVDPIKIIVLAFQGCIIQKTIAMTDLTDLSFQVSRIE